ncbi:LOG family protein [Chlamydiota bacterium]
MRTLDSCNRNNNTITFFGSATVTENNSLYNNAYLLAQQLSSNGFAIMNGGYGGIMEASAKGAREKGGDTIGVPLLQENVRTTNQWIKKEIVAKTLFERIELLISHADGIVIFPGGTGTLAELAITVEVLNKKILPQIPVVCFTDFWKPVIEVVSVNYPQTRKWVHFFDDITEIVEFLKNTVITRSET